MRTILILVFNVAIAALYAQDKKEKLTNSTIVSLHKAGLGKEVLITKIQASECVFDVSTSGMVDLKKAGVSDEVIAAMLSKDATTAIGNSKQDGTPSHFADLSSGIYYQDTSSRLIELEPAVFSQSKQGSGLLTSISYGLAKTKMKSSLSGSKANLQVSSARPTFYFVFEKDDKGNLNTASTWFSSAKSPNEFILVRLNITSNKKSREVVTGSYNSYEGLSAGIEDNQKVSFAYEKTAQGIYRIYFKENLASGEYCFLYAGSAAMYGAAPVYRVFDFGVGK
jgi:hypothetical protein